MQNEPLEVTIRVTGVLEALRIKTRAGELDMAYLKYWAAELRVSDLLERALVD